MKSSISCLLVLCCSCIANAAVISQFSSQGRLTGTSFGIPSQNATYDYVIIGGGTAGSVMAARLTENSNATVALVEAGNFYEISSGNQSQLPSYSQVGAGFDIDEYNPLIDWGLESTRQINGKMTHYAQGKNLGGSSGRNQMFYHRGTIGAYQAWADQVGDLSYTWANMTKYLQRSMYFTPPSSASQTELPNVNITYDASAFLSTTDSSNPLAVSYPTWFNPISQYIPAAFENIGLSQQAGFSSGVLHGYGVWTFTIDPTTGVRSSAESAFLPEAFLQNSLTTYINTLAQNIIFDSSKTAVAVNVSSNSAGTRPIFYTLSAKKEVILAAGPWHSPQILMLSGIGPAATLAKYGIPSVSVLEGVGQNMWDSTNISGPVYKINNDITTLSDYKTNVTLMTEGVTQFLTSGTGPFSNEGNDYVAWDRLPADIVASLSNATQAHLNSFPADWPQLEYGFSSNSQSPSSKLGSINILMVATASRGNMTISSASVLDRPVISPNWLLDPRDQEVAIAAYRRARQIWQGVPEGIRIGDEMIPGANVTSDDGLLAAIIKNMGAIHHASASCAMGQIGDPNAVVDSLGRVIGVQGLRVVDSSALPFLPPGHAQGTVFAHAEKMADIVLQAM